MSPSEDLRRALRDGPYELALQLSQELAPLSLADGLDLLLLAARDDERTRYDAMAVRWVTRLLNERVICLRDIEWLAERLQEAAEPTPTDAPKFVRQWLAKQPPR